VAKWRRTTTHKIYAHICFFLIGPHRKLNVTADGWLFTSWVDRPSHGKDYLLYWESFCKGLEFMGNCGRDTQSLTVHFDRELMKDCSSGSWDSCGVSLANVYSLCFICISLCFIFSYICISNERFLSKKGRIQCTALPWDSFHVLCFLTLKRIHVCMPFSHS